MNRTLPPPDPHTVIAALADLDVFKPGETPRILHKWDCSFRTGTCTCPGGAELLFADWNEQIPSLAYPTPERFYERYHA